ncbi:MAG: NAD(P)-dependent oxidoreductase [Candidatus Acididesulfobacter guangdongensis]|uniref:NAD(P)-dependent oxidoreductase n=1 Tax=Acididesulfobacter guangdongensis TaxID=2597225 RepID=A0A519BFG7_ACIG2|nr:MAG: NAD(P)-dependent oxidoreductase [Candidatus Acididesulfobacter guangdongensis]
MKVLIVGSTGFIGSHIMDNLCKHYDISIIATTRSIEKAQKFRWFNDKKVKTIEFDISQANSDVYNRLQRPDMMIHLAWDGLPDYKNMLHIEQNLYKNYFFIRDMVLGGLKDLTITGTCLEYGLKNGQLVEEAETNPVTPYGVAKDSLRRFLQELQKTINFNLKWLRLFYIHGKGQSPKSLLSQLDAAIKNNENIFNMSGGEQLRDYISVEKLAEYIVKTAFQNKITGIINCCSGKPISIRNLIENYIKEKGVDIELNLGYYPYLDYEPMAFWGDNSKLKLCCSKN